MSSSDFGTRGGFKEEAAHFQQCAALDLRRLSCSLSQTIYLTKVKGIGVSSLIPHC
jgi:hypothetical protein